MSNGRREEKEEKEEAGRRARQRPRGEGASPGGGRGGPGVSCGASRPSPPAERARERQGPPSRRGEAEGEGRKREVIGAEQEREAMSGRPRTTSFAESCKPVQQPSAFGSMKVSREYPAALRGGVGAWLSVWPCWGFLSPHLFSPLSVAGAAGGSPAGGRASERPQPRRRQLPFSPLPPSLH